MYGLSGPKRVLGANSNAIFQWTPSLWGHVHGSNPLEDRRTP